MTDTTFRQRLVGAIALTMALASPTIHAGDIMKGKAKSEVCAGCHGADGNSEVENFPRLAGQYEQYLYQALLDYKEGRRQSLIMSGFVATLNRQDMRDLAAYFASQTGLQFRR